MKNITPLYYFLCLLFLMAAPPLSAQGLKDIIKKPPEQKLVIDHAGVLGDFEKNHLEDKLKRYDDSTSNNLTIVLVKTLDGYSVEQGANELFRNWGIGQKGTDNGILLLAAIDDRKVRIEVGDGMEKAVTDYISSQIIDNDIRPNFKAQQYYAGLEAATDNLIKAAEGQYKAPKGYNKRGRGGGSGFGSLMFMMFVVFFILVIISRGGGGNNGGMMSRRGYRDWTGGGPVIISNWGGGGSSSGGGGGWSGGGGFGGFGGGSSSGGGASGDW